MELRPAAFKFNSLHPSPIPSQFAQLCSEQEEMCEELAELAEQMAARLRRGGSVRRGLADVAEAIRRRPPHVRASGGDSPGDGIAGGGSPTPSGESSSVRAGRSPQAQTQNSAGASPARAATARTPRRLPDVPNPPSDAGPRTPRGMPPSPATPRPPRTPRRLPSPPSDDGGELAPIPTMGAPFSVPSSPENSDSGEESFAEDDLPEWAAGFREHAARCTVQEMAIWLADTLRAVYDDGGVDVLLAGVRLLDDMLFEVTNFVPPLGRERRVHLQLKDDLVVARGQRAASLLAAEASKPPLEPLSEPERTLFDIDKVDFWTSANAATDLLQAHGTHVSLTTIHGARTPYAAASEVRVGGVGHGLSWNVLVDLEGKPDYADTLIRGKLADVEARRVFDLFWRDPLAAIHYCLTHSNLLGVNAPFRRTLGVTLVRFGERHVLRGSCEVDIDECLSFFKDVGVRNVRLVSFGGKVPLFAPAGRRLVDAVRAAHAAGGHHGLVHVDVAGTYTSTAVDADGKVRRGMGRRVEMGKR